MADAPSGSFRKSGEDTLMTNSSEEQRFSLAYGRMGEPVSDSKRMRRRLAALLEDIKIIQPRLGWSKMIKREHC